MYLHTRLERIDLYGIDILSDSLVFLTKNQNTRRIKMNYKTIDINTWNRGKLFKFYIDNMRIVMSLTVDIDVTRLVRFDKKHWN